MAAAPKSISPLAIATTIGCADSNGALTASKPCSRK